MTFNRKRTLAETLDSLLPQTVKQPDVEVLVCDNASEDGTDTLIQQYIAQYPILRYHRNPTNLGFDGNFIAGLKHARGEYIAYFSDDDIAPPGHVEVLLAELRGKMPCILYLNHIPFFHQDVRQLGRPLSPAVRQEFTDGWEFISFAGMGFVSSIILRREKALPFIDKVIEAAGAQLNIAFRMALTYRDLFIYDGLLSVYARYEYAGPPILIAGCVGIARLIKTLVAEGLMDDKTFGRWLGVQVKSGLARHVVSARGRNQNVYPLSGMVDLYGRVPAFYVRILPLYLIPGPIIRVSYRVAKTLLHLFRRRRYQSA